MAASRDLMYFWYLNKLQFDQLLYTDTDSVIVYTNEDNASHITLPTSDLLGDLKDEYGDLLDENSSWYLNEMLAYGPKMYQLEFKDMKTRKVVKWVKTMKGILLKGNAEMFSLTKFPCIGTPCWIFHCILQYGSQWKYHTMSDIWNAMLLLNDVDQVEIMKAVHR